MSEMVKVRLTGEGWNYKYLAQQGTYVGKVVSAWQHPHRDDRWLSYEVDSTRYISKDPNSSCSGELVADEAEATETDEVNHPEHYTSDPSGVECIQITRHRNFNVGNAIKYLWRAGLKRSVGKSVREKLIQDLKKAVWYIQDEIKRLEDLGDEPSASED